MYEWGDGVPKNYETALKWYRLALKQGGTFARYRIELLQKKIALTRHTPGTTTKKSPSPSPNALEKENEQLRKRIVDLEKRKQSKPKQVIRKSKPSPKAGSTGSGWSADFHKGLTAYKNGDYATALREIKPLAEEGDPNAQNRLADMYFRGKGVPQDYIVAAKWFKLSAEQGDADSQLRLGLMYMHAQGVQKNYKAAVLLFRRGANQGDAYTQSELAWMYEKGLGVPQNYKSAVKWYTLAAEQGLAEAQFKLGIMYTLGKGVTRNNKIAVKWHRLAANQGNTFSRDLLRSLQKSISELEEKRKNKPKPVSSGDFQKGLDAVDKGDFEAAIKEWTPLAKKGDIIAQYNLGITYSKKGPTQDFKAAFKWYNLAAVEGDSGSQYNLGVLYTNGEGVRPNDKIAAKWYRLAAEQGHNYAQDTLGTMYFQGKGVPQDYIRAHMWFNLAASQGNKLSRKKRNIIVKVMTPTQLETAQKLAQNFTPKKNKPSQPPTQSVSSGSGFFVSKLGHIITNAHVVKGCRSITVGDNAKKQVAVTLLEKDKRNDLALLKISNTQMASAETKSLLSKLGLKLVPTASEGLLRSDDVELGEDVLVSGYPYGEIYSNTIKVTKGIVSANRGIGDDTGQFQMDAAVQPGNSGGPIYDENGNIVGVVVSQLNKLKFAKVIGSLPENVNFGIKASTVRQFLTASGLPTKWSQRSQSMSTKELAKIAKNQTVMVVCRR